MVPLVLPAPASLTTLGICQTSGHAFSLPCPLSPAWFRHFVGAQLALVKLSLWVRTLGLRVDRWVECRLSGKKPSWWPSPVTTPPCLSACSGVSASSTNHLSVARATHVFPLTNLFFPPHVFSTSCPTALDQRGHWKAKV